MTTKSIRVDFWTLSAMPSGDYKDLRAVFSALRDRDTNFSMSYKGYTREIRALETNKTRTMFRGCLAKLRTTDIPHKGRLGGHEEKIELDPDQGLIEKNFFLFICANNLLQWQCNKNANGVDHLRGLLQSFSQCKVASNVVLEAGALERLLSGEGELKDYLVRVTKPTNATRFPKGNRIVDDIAGILSSGGGDGVTVRATTNSRLKTGSASFTETVVEALKLLAGYPGAKAVKATILHDDGDLEPLDLLAGRITSPQTVELEGRYPNVNSIYEAFARAYRENRPALDAVFGVGKDKLD